MQLLIHALTSMAVKLDHRQSKSVEEQIHRTEPVVSLPEQHQTPDDRYLWTV